LTQEVTIAVVPTKPPEHTWSRRLSTGEANHTLS